MTATNPAERIEHDSLGEVRLPADALYGPQTQRAVDNFPVSGRPMPVAFIDALCRIKAACARGNQQIGALDATRADAIASVAGRLVSGLAEGRFREAFPVDVYQTGSGTSSNMNVNEVIAHLSGDADVHPNDHVNMSQSSNDMVPSAIRVMSVQRVENDMLPALAHLETVLLGRAGELRDVVKTGRTHLMDATPIRFDQVIEGYVEQLRGWRLSLEQARDRNLALPLGGTAVGTGLNAPQGFAAAAVEALNRSLERERPFTLLSQPAAGMSVQDDSLALSSALRGVAAFLHKLANDLRWMNSGPLAGLGEISLPALQPGSSIMPGKVNPVVPESAAMVAVQVQGLDQAIAMAAQSGNFELNVMFPLVAANLDEMITLAANASRLLADKAIAGFTVNRERIERDLAANPILVTALNPVIGYEAGAAIAKRAYAEGRAVIDVAREMTDLDEATLTDLLDPRRLTGGD
ncbi:MULTISPECIES: class II fumarate hydratase [unclassified Guyparkeria]|uniref:class II fumarate hydratase n=1 Tax=unclassified Guyparkeria TaxID=2626246 RepID=UPI0007336D7E|nr:MULTISPECIES: class II fumarate hydratase [unclassified Guyparkeria]KTG17302.1 class II fumarate hydratase [Guyparkeria sp. XI15]OAE87279.1 class II fumarate hydratase [Guyparkeria sp. WRN-7]